VLHRFLEEALFEVGEFPWVLDLDGGDEAAVEGWVAGFDVTGEGAEVRGGEEPDEPDGGGADDARGGRARLAVGSRRVGRR
jgi:hypothetical protein